MINPFTLYPGQYDPTDADYPYGTPRNVSAPSAGDGSPWEQAALKDLWGFYWAAMAGASLVPSGTSETAQNSQMLAALKVILLERVGLFPEVGARSGAQIIPIHSNRFPRLWRSGMSFDWVSGVLIGLYDGECKNLANTADLIMPAYAARYINVNYGGASGGLPEGLSVVPSTWYQMYAVRKPGDDPTAIGPIFVPESSGDPQAFFNGATAIADGYTDNTLYRRLGWVYVNAGSSIEIFLNSLRNPFEWWWHEVKNEITGTSIGVSSRDAMVMATSCPPSCELVASLFMEHDIYMWVLLTNWLQNDIAPDSSHATFRGDVDDDTESMTPFQVPVNSSHTFYLRASGATDNYGIFSHGWIDHATVAWG